MESTLINNYAKAFLKTLRDSGISLNDTSQIILNMLTHILSANFRDNILSDPTCVNAPILLGIIEEISEELDHTIDFTYSVEITPHKVQSKPKREKHGNIVQFETKGE